MQVFWQANVLVGRYCNTLPGKKLICTIYEVFSNNGMGWLSPSYKVGARSYFDLKTLRVHINCRGDGR